MIIDKNFCMSSFLGLRYVWDQNIAWSENCLPNLNRDIFSQCIKVSTAQDIDKQIKVQLSKLDFSKTAIMLSGGMDCAILATYLPKGATAYTMRSIADGAVNEVEQAQKYAELCDLNLKIVDVTWDDYLSSIPILCKQKKSPFHSIEPLVYKCLLAAKNDGYTSVISGELADSVFGGLDGLLSRNWIYEEFLDRFMYLNPEKILLNSVNVTSVFEKYKKGKSIDVHQVIRRIFAIDSLNSYLNPANVLGVDFIAPYSNMELEGDLDLERIKNGENKYLIRELYKIKYPNVEPNKKLPMPRAVGVWLKDWQGPTRPEFKKININEYKPDQKWLMFILEQFLNLLDEGKI